MANPPAPLGLNDRANQGLDGTVGEKQKMDEVKNKPAGKPVGSKSNERQESSPMSQGTTVGRPKGINDHRQTGNQPGLPEAPRKCCRLAREADRSMSSQGRPPRQGKLQDRDYV